MSADANAEIEVGRVEDGGGHAAVDVRSASRGIGGGKAGDEHNPADEAERLNEAGEDANGSGKAGENAVALPQVQGCQDRRGDQADRRRSSSHTSKRGDPSLRQRSELELRRRDAAGCRDSRTSSASQ